MGAGLDGDVRGNDSCFVLAPALGGGSAPATMFRLEVFVDGTP